MIWVFAAVAVAYLPLFAGIAGSLHRLADAVCAQNKHYGIPVTNHAQEPKA